MAKSQLTFQKKERAKRKQIKKQQKQERREFNKTNNNKGKPLEEMFAYVDEFGSISDTPPELRQDNKEKTPTQNHDEFLFGRVSYYNDKGRYGFIRNNLSRETVYFNDNIVGMVLNVDEKVKYKTTRSKQGIQASEVSLL